MPIFKFEMAVLASWLVLKNPLPSFASEKKLQGYYLLPSCCRAKKNFKVTIYFLVVERKKTSGSHKRKKRSFAESKWQAEKGEFLVLWACNELVFKLRLCELCVCM
jgi:hypothetical protein